MLANRNLHSVDVELKTAHGFGAVRFSSSRRRPAPWICVSAQNSRISQKLHVLMCGEHSIWNLKAPTSLISVTGGAMSLNMSDKQKMIFQRGLIGAASTTNAWIMTGGTDTGVMKLVGKTVQESNLDVPCIGVVPWGVIADREKLTQKENGTVHNYVGVTTRSSDPNKTHVALDPNHTHFVFVDSGNEGSVAFGDEIELRSQLENCVCNSSKTRVETRANCIEAMTPMVLVVVGGGMGTLRTIVHTLQNERPVVVFGDSGGAAAHIRAFHTKYTQAGHEHLTAMWGVVHEYIDLLTKIHRLGTVTKGIHQHPLLTFFNTSDDISAGNDFDQRILAALLSNCQDTIDAINLAVFWRNPLIIKMQLRTSNMYEPRRLSHAFEHALMCQNAAVVRVLIEHNARPTFIIYSNLWFDSMHARQRMSTPTLIHQMSMSAVTSFVPRHALAKICGIGYANHIEARLTVSNDRSMCTTWCDLVVWAVVSGQCEMARCLWVKTREPLRSALNAIKIAVLNAQCESSPIRRKQWENDACQYERWAEGILNHMEVNDAMELLMTIEMRNSTCMWPRSILDEATRTDNASIRRFISHPHCQQLLDNLFCGHFPDSTASIHQHVSVTCILIQLVLLPFINLVDIDCRPKLLDQRQRVTPCDDIVTCNKNNNESDDSDNEWFQTVSPSPITHTKLTVIPYLSRLWIFSIPKVKFVTHNCLKCIYALMLSLMLCKMQFVTNRYQYFVWFWTCTLLFEECRQLSLQGVRVYFTFWNICDLVTYMGILSVAIVRLFIIPYAEPWWATLVYALVILLVYVRFIESLGAWRSVGVLRIILTQMICDVITWFTIILFFTTGTGLAFVVLVQLKEDDVTISPFWSVFWGLLGNMEPENQATDGNERIRATIISVLMWVYSFIATIIFVNLLIAQMTSTYDRVKVEADEFWQFERVTLIREYKDNRESIPPPFNIVLYFVLFCRTAMRRIGRYPTINLRGFRQLCNSSQADVVFSKSYAARTKYMSECDIQQKDTVVNQMEMLKHGQRSMEADLRMQLEIITGRFDTLSEHLDSHPPMVI